MPSHSLQRWNTHARAALDQIQAAHAAVGGNEPGRRFATLQINHAYLVLISSHFQGFCRALHTEAVDYVCNQPATGASDPRRDILRITLTLNRQLDSKNPSPGHIGSDFGRFNIQFWDRVKARAPTRNQQRQALLEMLNTWRNAIAHQDFAGHGLRPDALTLPMVRQFRSACHLLAARFDEVVADHLAIITGSRPW
jgi:hypothetical protein